METSWEDDLWTDRTRATFLEAGEAAIAALRAHLDTVAAARGTADEPAIDESAEAARLALLAVSDAQWDYSATPHPFSMLRFDDEDEEEGDEDDGDEEELDAEAEHNQLSVLVRRDFRLTSQAALMEAGRAAYARVWPDDPPEAAAEDVWSAGRAIYQIIHAGGLDALVDVDGLQPVVGLMLTVGREELLSEAELDDVIDDPNELLVGEGEIIYSQADVWM